MKIAIIGSSRGVGKHCVLQGLKRGHQIISLSRTVAPECQHPNLYHLVGDATRSSVLKPIISQSDAVIVTIGAKNISNPNNLFTNTAFALCEACNELYNKQIPIIIVSAYGVGSSYTYLKWYEKLIFRTVKKKFISNKTSMEEIIIRSKLNWVLVRPKLYSTEKLFKKYTVITDYNLNSMAGRTSRLALAHYLILQAENPRDLFKFPVPVIQ